MEKMTDDEYNSLDGIRSTTLKNVAKYGITEYAYPIEFDSSTLLFGRMFHCMLLEPDEFDKRYAREIFPESKLNKNSNDYKNGKKKWLDSIRDKEVVSFDDYDLAARMCKETMRRYGNLINQCQKEVVFKKEMNGEVCKIKADLFVNFGNTKIVIDVKSIGYDATIKEIEKNSHDYNYPLQMSYYGDISDASSFILFVSSKTTRAILYEPNRQFIEYGRQEYGEALNMISEYKQNTPNIIYQSMALPAWKQKQLNGEMI